MDLLKIFLTFCVALFFALMGFVFLVGSLAGLAGLLSQNNREETQIIILQICCGIPALAFGAGTIWALRSIWFQVAIAPNERKKENRKKKPKLSEVMKSENLNGIRYLDLRYLTGAGWLLGLSSAAITGVLAIIISSFFGVNADGPPENWFERKMLGYIFISMFGFFLGLGYFALKYFGVVLYDPPRQSRNSPYKQRRRKRNRQKLDR